MSTGRLGGGLVPRPELLGILERAAAGPVTLVTGPAGSGKTVLVRSWLEDRGPDQPAAWVSVERGERDPQRFWTTLVNELRAAGANIEALTPSPEFDGAAAVRELVAELVSLNQRLVLVIDDLHEVGAADILEQLSYLLDHLPSALHVLLITRHDLQLGLHRRRLAGELTELRSADLRFTLDETRTMLSALGIGLSETSLQLLHDRTEGWVAGLRLATISLTGHPDPERFVVQFSGSERTVAEYLLAEVLQRQPAHVRRLLLRASLFDRINGPLGDLLTGSSDSGRQLQALADAGAFVVVLDSNRTWFRLHHLLGDLLAVELRHTEPDQITRLQLAAAKWYAEHGFVIEAITHAQAAGDRDMAAGLLIEHYFSLTLDGRQATAHALLDAFAPYPEVAAPEVALVIAAEQLAEGSLDQAAAYLGLAQRHAEAVPGEGRHRFDMAMLVNRLTLARRLGDFRSVLAEVQPLKVLPAASSSRDISMYNDVRAVMLMNLGIVEVWSGRLDEGSQHLQEARQLAGQIGRPYIDVACRAHLASVTSWRSFTQSLVACREAIALAETHGWGSDAVIGPALVTMGTSLMQTGRLDEAEAWLARAEQMLRPDLEPAIGLLLHMAYGGLYFARGHSAEAIERFRDAERLGVLLVTGSPLATQLRSSTLRIELDLGQTAAVRDVLAGLTEAELDAGEGREVLARLALAEGDAKTAVAVLGPTLSGRAGVHHVNVLVRSLIFEGLARQRLGDTRGSEDAVERALELAEEDSLILPFLHTPSRELLERHPRYRTAHAAFIDEILDVLYGQAITLESAPPEGLLEELSDAELRILRYLPTNLSSAGIANEIYVSANTVKTHMRTIYAKLNAHTRAEAVARGRALGLLGHTARHP
ncbi:MAG: AAA family ATPase [Chloroflexota bacterium]